MTTVPLGEARDRLSELISEVDRSHERISITRHGHAAAVLISQEDLASLEETLDILTTPGETEAVREGLADASGGNFADNDTIRKTFRR